MYSQNKNPRRKHINVDKSYLWLVDLRVAFLFYTYFLGVFTVNMYFIFSLMGILGNYKGDISACFSFSLRVREYYRTE